MSDKHKLIPLTPKTKIYARPEGGHYHLSKKCPMLQGGGFRRLKYAHITATDIKYRRLNPCSCAFADFNPRRRAGERPQSKPSFATRLFRFFFPKDFKGELRRGMEMGSGSSIAKALHGGLYNAGKKARKAVDPEHRMRFGKEKR